MASAVETRPPLFEVDDVDIGSSTRVRGAPVWSGFVIALATWVLLELGLVALELTGINAGPGAADADEWWWSALAAASAFFLGGLVAGASISSRRSADGVLNGITVWAIGVLAVVILAALGAGVGFGAFGDVLNQTTQGAQGGGNEVLETARDAAGAATLALGLTVAAAAGGGAIGAKLWPRRQLSR